MNDYKFFMYDDYIKFKDYLLSRNSNIKLYKKNSYLNNFSKTFDHIYFILDGAVTIALTDKNGNKNTLITLGENTIAPFYAPRNFSVENSLTLKAVKDTHVIAFTNEEFSDLLQSNRNLNDQMHINCLKFINFLAHKNLSLIAYNGINRISIFLLNYINEHNPPNNVIPLSQKDISGFIGLNQINMCRNIKKLKDMNIVKTGRSRIIILDVDKLTELCKIS